MKMKTLRSKRLCAGDIIGLISPASPVFDILKIDNAVKYLESSGYKVQRGKNIYKRNGFLAGTDIERADDINRMFADDEVKAIFCLRGGYGSGRLLPLIDYNLIKANPKIFAGYSDITALHLALFKECKLITFSAPMPAVDFQPPIEEYTVSHFFDLISSKNGCPTSEFHLQKGNIISNGKAGGPLLGGNLTLVTSLIGTPFLPNFKDAVLFLEEIEEAPYRIDRMLNQLSLSGLLAKISGVILGAFTNCKGSNPEKPTLSLEEIFHNYFTKLNIPVIKNFPHGHITEFQTLPLGCPVTIDTEQKKIIFEINPVI